MAVPVLTVEAAFTVGASTGSYLQLDDLARGYLDSNTLAPDAVWTDISDFVLSVSTNRGARRIESPVIRYEPGTATIVLDNSDRRFDPTNLGGPYTATVGIQTVTQVVPMCAVRIRATYAGVTYDIWRGFADEWRISYADPSWSQVVLTATDAFKVLANFDRPAGPSVGASETTGARINRILNSIGWSTIDRLVATGDSTVQATTLAANSLTELRLTSETEFGEFYIDAGGRAFFRNRRAALTDARSVTSQATFGDGGGAELPYEAVEVAYDDSNFVNRALISRAGGAQQQVDNATSQASYLIRPLLRTDLLMETDSGAADWAGYLVSLAGQPELRFASMSVFPRENEATLFPQVLGRQLGDRLTIIRRPPGGGSPITRDVFIRGIEHQVSDEFEWRTVWTLESATRYQFMILDNALLGMLDNNSLGF